VSAIVLRGDARSLPLPDGSVDLIVTSPPYFGLRSYTDGGKHYDGQIGSERTPREYVANLLDCTREWMRVLKPEGSIFVNLGDKYSQRVATRPSSHQDGLFPGRPELRKDWKRDRAAGLTRMPYENVIDGAGKGDVRSVRPRTTRKAGRLTVRSP
jgi:DNA modification methylase